MPPVRVIMMFGLVAEVAAQQPSWVVLSGSPNGQIERLAPFADYDDDGIRDVLVNGWMTGFYVTTRILSGATGATLWQGSYVGNDMAPAGDPDGDGHPDIMAAGPFGSPLGQQDQLAIWSPARNQILWQALAPWESIGHALLGEIDVNGDGRDDAVCGVVDHSVREVRVYNHNGASLYTIPLLPLGWVPESFANMGDMNGDGCDDFVMGCRELSRRGVMALVSGLTGQVFRTSYGLMSGDDTSWHAANVGDIDGDSVNDFIGCSHWSSQNGRIVAYSGATGNVVHSIPLHGESVNATEDLDLDGIRDVVFSAGYQVSQTVFGRTFAYSLRDGSLLWTLDNVPSSPQLSGDNYAHSVAGVGRIPGSPYPTLVFLDFPIRVRAVRAIPRGQGPVTGAACSSAGPAPNIGVRATASGSRITVSRAAPGSLALLSLSSAGQASFGGQALPLGLAPYGWAGCTMFVGPDVAQMKVVGNSGADFGYAAVDLLGLDLAPLGWPLAAQWFVLDPVQLSYAATARHALQMQ